MLRERSEAVVLRAVDYSETSRVVTFLTPDRGRMACMAKGVRRKNSPLAHALGAFNRVELVYGWKDGREVQSLYEVSLLDGYEGIRAHSEKPFYAALPVEVAGKLGQPGEPSEELFGALCVGLDGLSAWAGDVRTHAAWQVWRLMCVAGFEPELEEGLAFSYVEGATRSGGGDVRLTVEQRDALRAMVSSEENCPLERVEGVLFRMACDYARAQLEADLRSARVLRDMFG